MSELHLRRREAGADDSERVVHETAHWEPARTALLLCDVWDKHWCQGATGRVDQLAPAIAALVVEARKQGMLIVHSPSDTLDFYTGTPARENARNAPFLEAPPWIGHWESLDPTREPPLPIDDSDGGCDCEPPCVGGKAWSRQHPAIEIRDEDIVTDNGQEFFNLLAARGIENVLVAGVHTNMCVLGRPFGIRRLVKLGKKVALIRDLTDTMYNSRMPPHVTHHEGTARVIAHIERWWCPTVTSVDITGKPAFRFADAPDEPLTFDDIYVEKVFDAKSLREPVWLKDGLRFSYLEKAAESEAVALYLYDTTTGERSVVMPAKVENPIPGYQWSPDETKLLIAPQPKHRSFGAGESVLWLFDTKTGERTPLTDDGPKRYNAKFLPDGKTIGYVRDSDLCLLDLATRTERLLTDTGTEICYNGRFGWVYEEELELTDGWFPSPDGTRIAFFRTDEAAVPVVALPDTEDPYQGTIPQRYPKAGDVNPTVRLGILDITPSTETTGMPTVRWVDTENDGGEEYIARAQWTPQGELLLQVVPRLQNRIDVRIADPATGKSRLLFTDTDDAWVELPHDLRFIGESDTFLFLSERSGYRHLYQGTLTDPTLTALTSGEFDVTGIAGIDSEARAVFFVAASPTPEERQLFRVSLDGGEAVRVSPAPGTHNLLFATDGKRYLDTYSDRKTPPRTVLCDADGSEKATIVQNPMEKLTGKRVAAWERRTFETSDGVTLHAQVLLPPDFDPTRKYPVLMYTYGGPNSQVTNERFGGGLDQLLAADGYLYVQVDGRGAGGRGAAFRKVTYLRLGEYEVRDQIAAARWLGTLPYVDPERIGIWGWSYGGYMASLCILRGAEVFKAAVAVAPVTDWKYYDTIYTERYLRRPVDNPDGYSQNNPVDLAAELKGSFLLIHGIADDNVHFRNATALAAALQKQGKPFEMMAYPGEKHGLSGVTPHVFGTIRDFIRRCL